MTAKHKAEKYQSRYSPNWGETSRKCRAATGGICCCCMRAPATEAHHTRYSKNGKSIRGKEKSGEDIFGLCKFCHETVAHSPKNWIRDKKNPELFNRNRPEFAALLRRNYRILSRKPKFIPKGKKNGEEDGLLITLLLILFIAIVLYVSF